MDVLQTRHANCDMPLWTRAVAEEIEKGANQGHRHCKVVMDARWLGEPAEINSRDQREYYLLWVGLSDGQRPPTKHKGEAQSIFLAERSGGVFLTDDAGAYDFAERRPKLGIGKVRDSIDVLRSAVAMSELTKEDACDLVLQIEGNGRSFRGEHRGRITPNYFAC